MKNWQTYLTVIAFLVTALSPVLVAEGYTGKVPPELVPLAGGLTALVSILVRWYKERGSERANSMNL